MKRLLLFLGTMMCLTFIFPIQSLANSTDKIPYHVMPVVNETQEIGVNSSIFINVSDLDTQTIEIEVSNVSKESIKLKVSALNAIPTSSGGIQYITEKKQNNNTLTRDLYLTDLMDIQKSIVLEPNETKTITGTVDLTKLEGEFYDLLGGVSFGIDADHVTYKDSNTFNINNEFERVIGVNFQNNTEEYLLENLVELNKSYVNQLPTYYQIMLPITFNNKNTLYDVSLDYEVKDKDGVSLFANKKEPFNIAPYSKAELSFVWESETFNPKETYYLSGVIRYKNQEYHFNEKVDSSISNTDKVSKPKINGTPTVEKNSFNYKSSILILLLLILIMIISKKIYDKHQVRREQKN